MQRALAYLAGAFVLLQVLEPRERHARALALQDFAPADAEAGRRCVEAYVEYMRRRVRRVKEGTAIARHAGAVALGVMLSAWSVADAQEIRGAIRSENDLNPIDGASITVIDERERELGQSVTDSLGLFVLPVPRPGDYRVRVERIGYASFTSATVSLAGAEVVRVEIRLSESAVSLDAITIVSRRRDPHTPLAGYYARLDFYGRMGIGRLRCRSHMDAAFARSRCAASETRLAQGRCRRWRGRSHCDGIGSAATASVTRLASRGWSAPTTKERAWM